MTRLITRRDALRGGLAFGMAGTGMLAFGRLPAHAQQAKLALAHIYTTTTPNHLAVQAFAETLKEKLGDQMAVEVLPGAQMGGERDIVDSISVGSLDAGDVSAGVLATVFPKVGLFAAPYVFRDRDHQLEVVNGPIGTEIYEGLRKEAGIRVLASYFQPPRHLTSNREIKSAADAKGLKLRVPEVPVWTRYWQTVGANPTPINFSEVYTSLQLGVVEAQENPYIYVDSGKLFEVQKFLTLTAHVRNMEWIVINEEKFSSFDKPVQEALIEAGQAAQSFLNERWLKDDDTLRQKFLDAGMKLVDADVESFRKVMLDSYDAILGNADLSDLFKRVNA